MKRRLIALLALLLVLGGIAWLVLPRTPADAYRTQAATRGDISRVISATGRLNPEEVVTVGTQVSGSIQKMYVKNNEAVHKGELLAEIDPTLPQAQLEQSKSSMDNSYYVMVLAERNLKRTKTLQEKGYIAVTDLENAEQAYRTAQSGYLVSKAQYERDKANLEYTKIRSPIEGVIIQAQVSAGQTMAANFQAPEMFKIARDLTRMTIDVGLTEADIGQVKVGQNVRFTVDAYPQKEFTGIVQIVNLNPNTQQDITTYSVIVNVENKDKLLLPGMTAYVSIVLEQKENVLRVPAAALRFRPPIEHGSSIARLFGTGPRERWDMDSGEGQTVYVLQGGRPAAIPVTIGGSDDTNVEITGGDVKEGDPVIVSLLAPNEGS